MKGTDPNLLSAAEQMRRAFDESFALPEAAATEDVEGFLGIRICGDPYAIRLSEMSGLESHHQIVALPCDSQEFLGLAGIEGRLMPIYSLATLLGCSQQHGERWVAVCGREERVGLAFADLDGYLSARKADLCPFDASQRTKEHVRDGLRSERGVQPVLHVPSLISTIRKRAPSARSSVKEQ